MLKIWLFGIALFMVAGLWTGWHRREFDAIRFLLILAWPMVILWLAIILVMSFFVDGPSDGD